MRVVRVESGRLRGECMESPGCKGLFLSFQIGTLELRLCKEHSRELRNALSEAEAEAKKREAP